MPPFSVAVSMPMVTVTVDESAAVTVSLHEYFDSLVIVPFGFKCCPTPIAGQVSPFAGRVEVIPMGAIVVIGAVRCRIARSFLGCVKVMSTACLM
jgi:hypothetical protein